MVSQGHADARYYPIGQVWSEVPIVMKRINGDYATTAVMTNMAVAAVVSKKANSAFKKTLTKLKADSQGEG